MKLNNASLVFFGTHEFASTILHALINHPNLRVDLVVTQPDKPVGRKKELQQSPVKKLADKQAIDVLQPTSLQNYKFQISNYDLAIVAQYGLLIPVEIFSAPKFGTLNVHTSLLPKYRGASPIQSALINGETETGVTIMQLNEGLDTGPILAQKSLPIEADDTYLTLESKLAQIGAQALLETIPRYLEGTLLPQPQDNSKATVCGQLTRDDGQIDWNKTSLQIYNLYRGLTPWPGVWTLWKNKRLKLLRLKPADKNLPAGKVLVESGKIYIGSGNNAVEILELQLEGKKPMTPAVFVNGYADFVDASL